MFHKSYQDVEHEHQPVVLLDGTRSEARVGRHLLRSIIWREKRERDQLL